MRMRIARPHHLAAILKDLYGIDPVQRSEFEVLPGPCVDHASNLGDAHASYGEAVIGEEADDPADASLRVRDKQFFLVVFKSLNIRLQCGEIIVENECALVLGIADSPGARITRTQIAIRIVGDRRWRCLFLNLTLPGTLRPVRRNQHPFACQGVPSSVRLFR